MEQNQKNFSKREMRIEETIDRWFEEIKQKLTGGKTCYNQYELDMDSLCLGVIRLVENYVESVLLLLNAEKKLPAKALLRVISDLCIKYIWCLRGYEQNVDEFNKRFEKWYYASISQGAFSLLLFINVGSYGG